MPFDSKEKLIKSKARVRDQGEVFTPAAMVKNMVSMLDEVAKDYTKSVLEPTCGNGNFLVEILSRRINSISKRKKIDEREYLVLVVLSKIYGVDIMQDNVREARSRLMGVVSGYFENSRNSSDFLTAAASIIERNIICGDALKHKSSIIFLEWTPLDGRRGFEINPHSLAQIENDMKDVVVASTIKDIKIQADSIFAPKKVDKISTHRIKKTTNQVSLFVENRKVNL